MKGEVTECDSVQKYLNKYHAVVNRNQLSTTVKQMSVNLKIFFTKKTSLIPLDVEL